MYQEEHRSRAAIPGCQDPYPLIVGEHPRLKAALQLARTAAEDGECNVLLTGETGTGKELFAYQIHSDSRRSGRPFQAVNAAALPPSLAESLLFGHEKGAYTDASRAREGLFRSAAGGTVFLDEVQELDLQVQAKLLRFLQNHRVTPLGGRDSRPVDVRIVAGSNQDLQRQVELGRFRADLYYRLNVLPIHLPPLRERRADVPLLVDHFLDHFNRRKGTSVSIGPRAYAALAGHSWPGNVRELRNLIERLVIISRNGTVRHRDLPHPLFPDPGISQDDAFPPRLSSGCPDLCLPLQSERNLKRAKEAMIAAFEREFIYRHLMENDWHITNTAVVIGQSREWLSRLIRKYQLKPQPLN